MSTKQAKKFRKQIRKDSQRLAKAGYGKAMMKIARQRDWITVFSLVEAVAIISMIVWYMNA